MEETSRRRISELELTRSEDGRVIIQLPDDDFDEPDWLAQARADFEARSITYSSGRARR